MLGRSAGERMVRKFEEKDLETVMELWLAGNLQAHSFIPEQYW